MKVIHCCIDIRGVLRWGERGLRGMFRKADGRKMTGAEVREYLLDQLEAGRKVLPMGEPCEGWSYETGCPGHREEDCLIPLQPEVVAVSGLLRDAGEVISRTIN